MKKDTLKKQQPSFYRQRLILALISVFDEKLTRLDLQKLLFLFMEESFSKKKAYEFVPYHYGCYSFQANADLKTMHNYGFIHLDENTKKPITLNKEVRVLDMVKEEDREKLLFFAIKYDDLRGDDLIRHVYKNYPYYTQNSKIAHKFLKNKYKKEDSLFPDIEDNLYTIGYEGITFENYLNKLINNSINILCDVRKNPYSMKFGFSKNQLKHAVEQMGIKYIHLPELGIESENRQELNCLKDYQKLFNEYEKTILRSLNAQKALEYIHEIVKDEKIALTCFERDIEYCHRGVIAKTLFNKYEISYNNIS